MDEKEIRGHLEFLAKTDQGEALRERIGGIIREVDSVSSIPNDIITSDSLTISANLIGRIQAKKYLETLLKELTPPKKEEPTKNKTHV